MVPYIIILFKLIPTKKEKTTEMIRSTGYKMTNEDLMKTAL